MSDPENIRRQLHPAVIALLIAFAIPIVYFATYFTNLDRKVYRFTGVDPASGINRHHIEPSFRCLETGSTIFFQPALWFDRHLRNEYWDTVEKKDGTKWRNP